MALDLTRSGALLAMAIYHFCFDLEMFGWLPPATATTGALRVFAIATASSFLFLAGVSLWLAHGQGIRWRPFWRRLAMVVAAAAAISVSSLFWAPGAPVYFGILHAIATMSVLGLAFLRLPAAALIVLAAAVLALPFFWSSPAFDPRWLAWTGFAQYPPPSVDFEPVFPWFAAFLAGMATGRIGTATGLWDSLRGAPGPVANALAFPGRHSLIVYLLHQPVLIALVAGATQLLR
ncbi:DUF1624 domain-containing protein [Rhodobacterales bacterium HKCCE3408]|nr:DUF1624 domain-containing protein [Rhodobacterales bacterium HKCCE3408]